METRKLILDDFLSIGRTLVDDPTDTALPSCLGAARRVLASGTTEALLRAALLEERVIGPLLELVSAVDHIGFLVPTDSKVLVSAAAAAAGFDQVHSVFSSTVISRELGELSGRGRIPTTILKAIGSSPAGLPLVVEVFMPTAEGDEVREWIGRGVRPHLAFRPKSKANFPAIIALVQSVGFRLPTLMVDGPLTNPNESVTTVYLDRKTPGEHFRIEFIYYAEGQR